MKGIVECVCMCVCLFTNILFGLIFPFSPSVKYLQSIILASLHWLEVSKYYEKAVILYKICIAIRFVQIPPAFHSLTKCPGLGIVIVKGKNPL